MTSLLAEPHVPFGLPIRDAQQPRLLDAVRSACRVRHYSIRTETAYTSWARRFCRFHRGADGQPQHPATLAEPHVAAFLVHHAEERHVAV